MISGRSVAIESWQIMQVFTLGMPASGPLVTASWHVSVHFSMAFSTCVLCGNGIGCSAAGRTRKKSRTAAVVVRWAGVKTSLAIGVCVHPDAAAPRARLTIQQRTRIRRALLFRTEAAQIDDDVPDVFVLHLGLHRLHVELRADAVLDVGEDLAVAGSVIPLRIDQIGWMRIFWGERAVAGAAVVMTELAVLVVGRLAGVDRLGRCLHRILDLRRVGVLDLRAKDGGRNGNKPRCRSATQTGFECPHTGTR